MVLAWVLIERSVAAVKNDVDNSRHKEEHCGMKGPSNLAKLNGNTL